MYNCFCIVYSISLKAVNVTHAIATMQGIEDETERRQTLVNQMRLDASSSDGIKQLKGRTFLLVKINRKIL